MHPVGPEPPVVYWLRRAAFVLVILTVIAVLWWLIGAITGGGGGDATPAADSTTQSATAEPSPTDSTVPNPEPTAIVDCEDAAIKVTASTDATTYTIGASAKLSMVIQNVGDVTCTRDVGPKANELKITSGGYHVWSSDDCSPKGKSKVIEMEPGDKVASSVTWNGQLSEKGCPANQPQAKPGRYSLEARNGDVISEGVPFAVANPDA